MKKTIKLMWLRFWMKQRRKTIIWLERQHENNLRELVKLKKEMFKE